VGKAEGWDKGEEGLRKEILAQEKRGEEVDVRGRPMGGGGMLKGFDFVA